MWAGFALPMLLLSAGSLHKHYEAIPEVSLNMMVPTLPGLSDLYLAVRFIVVGLTYFLSLEISFSLWFFYLFYQLQVAIFALVGYSITETRSCTQRARSRRRTRRWGA